MLVKVFIDTSAFFALEDAGDHHHKEARAIQERFKVDHPLLFTTHHILDESVTLIGARLSPDRAIHFARRLLGSQIIQMIRSNEELEAAALHLYERFQDGRLSCTDCLSFATMRAFAIDTAFAFDRHFERAGFIVLKNSV